MVIIFLVVILCAYTIITRDATSNVKCSTLEIVQSDGTVRALYQGEIYILRSSTEIVAKDSLSGSDAANIEKASESNGYTKTGGSAKVLVDGIEILIELQPGEKIVVG